MWLGCIVLKRDESWQCFNSHENIATAKSKNVLPHGRVAFRDVIYEFPSRKEVDGPNIVTAQTQNIPVWNITLSIRQRLVTATGYKQ